MFKIALFGYGRIGQMHAENIFNHNKFKLVYVYDKDIKLASKSKKRFNCNVISNYKIALKD